MSRRTLLAGLATAPVSLSLLLAWPSSSLLGCGSPESQPSGGDIAGRIRDLYAGPGDAAGIARASGWTLDQATKVLSDMPPAPADAGALRAQLERRIRDDFAANRMRPVADWWLADTEIAIAVVVAGRR